MRRKTGWLVALLGTCIAGMAAATPAGALGKVELLRDPWGVPHVFAQTDRGAMYGLGYATAEDRGFQMHYFLRMMQGRLAETIGDVKKTRRKETALQNDRKMRTFGFYRAAQALVPHLDEQTRGLLEAYSDGVNAYFDRHRDHLPATFAKLGLEPQPWTPADCLVSWWHLAQFFATDGTRDLMRYRLLTEGHPRDRMLWQSRGGGRTLPPRRNVDHEDLTPLGPDEAASVVQRGDVTDQWLARTRDFLRKHGYARADSTPLPGQPAPGPKFSHAWVADGKTTGSGSAVLVSKPQTGVTNPSLFYEFHLRGKTFDARGCGVAGSPIILIGWNRHVAWGMTALGADQADLFRLKTDDDHPGQYLFDGQWRPIRTIRQEIKVKHGPTQTLDIRLTHLGPVVNEFAFARPGDPLVALKRIPLCETDRDTIQGALAMIRSESVAEFFRALEGWRFPTANVVFGDSAGNIGYSTAGALVLRSPLALEAGGAAHDGSQSRYDWRAIVPQRLVPHVINPRQGYLFSGNHRPIGSFYPIPIGIRTGSMGDTLRSLRLRQIFARRASLGPDRLLAISRDAVNPARAAIVRTGFHLRDVLGRELSPQATAALKHLQAWRQAGCSSQLDTPGAALATQINTMFRMVNSDLTLKYGGGESGLSRLVKTLNRRMEKNPQAEISRLEQAWIDDALAFAWHQCLRLYGDDPATWDEQARRQVAARRLGYGESLDGFGSVDPANDLNVPPLLCVDGGTISSQAAEAYVQWVPLADVDRARSILPPGQSEVPGSPTRTVNLENWAAGKLHPAPLSRQAVEKIAVSRTVLLE